MNRPSLPAALLLSAGLVMAAGEASAQAAPASGEAAGLRYLSWNGRAAAPVAAAAAAPTTDTGLRRPNAVIPHGGVARPSPAPFRAGLTPAPGGGQGLTPANRWMHPAAAPGQPAPPPPAPVAAEVRPAPAPVRAAPDYLPDQGGRGQPVPAEVAYAPSTTPDPAPSASVDPSDPMAPRRDAPVFRMQRTPQPRPDVQPEPAPGSAPAATGERAPAAAPTPRRVALVTSNPDDRPPAQGARYYSVHRQIGRRPDALTMPEPTYVDALAVNLPATPASQDLAQPAEPPALIRDSQGRLRAAPAAPDGDYQ